MDGSRGRLPALDGMRGVAVGAVLLYHGGVSWARGGFLGVDVFFVLSGFLITALLVDERRRTRRIDLLGFWTRRIRRLAPALLLVAACVTLYAVVVAPPELRPGLHGDLLATLAYVGNWHFATHRDGYFELGTPSPLLHTWSLAIEEQFYLVWPVVAALALARPRGRDRLIVVAGGGAAVSAALLAYRFGRGVDANLLYLGTDTRVLGLLIGAALGALVGRLPHDAHPRPGARRVLGRLGGAGAAFVLFAMTGTTADAPWLYRGGFAAVALAVAVVILDVVVVPRGRIGRLLSLPPLVGLGRISYGLYLWHWPVFLVLTHARTGLSGPALLFARIAATLAIARASYVLVELPALTRPARSWRLPAVAGATAALLAVVAAVTAPPPYGGPGTATAAEPVPGEPVAGDPAPVAGATGRPGTAPSAAASPAPVDWTIPPLGRTLDVLVVGDSVASTLAQALPRPPGVRVVNRGELGCGIATASPYRYFGSEHVVPASCHGWRDRWRGAVARHDPDVVVVLVGRWEVMDRVLDGAWTRVGEPAYDAHLRQRLEESVPLLTAYGARVVFCTAPFYRRGERPDGGTWPEDDPERVARFNVLLREVAARHAGVVSVVDLGGRLAPEGRYTSRVSGIRVRSDGVHLTGAGGRWLAPWLYPVLAAAARPAQRTLSSSSSSPSVAASNDG